MKNINLNIDISDKEAILKFTYKDETYKIVHQQSKDNDPKMSSFVNETLKNDDQEPLDDDIVQGLDEMEEEIFRLMDDFAYLMD